MAYRMRYFTSGVKLAPTLVLSGWRRRNTSRSSGFVKGRELLSPVNGPSPSMGIKRLVTMAKLQHLLPASD